MSRKPSFANLRQTPPAPRPVADGATGGGAAVGMGGAETSPPASGQTPPRAASREGRKQIAGFFTPDMSFALHMLARRQDRSLQSLMAEAFNDVLRKHGESPMGE